MSNGITICLDEFERLPSKKQMKCIFENTEILKTSVARFRFHQKVQYALMSFLVFAVGFLADKMFIK